MHPFCNFDPRQQNRIEAKLDLLLGLFLRGGQIMDAKFQDLHDQVQATTDVELAALALIQGFAARLEAAVAAAQAAGATPEELAAITAEAATLKASAVSLAAAVTANTPAA
jgi:hypothetical protein